MYNGLAIEPMNQWCNKIAPTLDLSDELKKKIEMRINLTAWTMDGTPSFDEIFFLKNVEENSSWFHYPLMPGLKINQTKVVSALVETGFSKVLRLKVSGPLMPGFQETQ